MPGASSTIMETSGPHSATPPPFQEQGGMPEQGELALDQRGSADANALRRVAASTLLIVLMALGVLAFGKIQLPVLPQFTTLHASFILAMAEISHPQDAALVAEKIIRVLATPFEIDGHPVQIGVSIGIAVYPIDGTDDTQELMKKADMAMYAAKESGRNCYRFYDDELRERLDA
jgi:hypothetical protein